MIMKKLVLATALFIGLGTTAVFAGNQVSDVEIVTAINEFKPIEINALPQAVQDTISKNFPEATIKNAAMDEDEEGVATYKVVVVNADNSEKTVYLSANGEILE